MYDDGIFISILCVVCHSTLLVRLLVQIQRNIVESIILAIKNILAEMLKQCKLNNDIKLPGAALLLFYQMAFTFYFISRAHKLVDTICMEMDQNHKC